MKHISPFKAALSVGAVVGLWHLMWVTLVALGWAKPVMDFILRLHFLEFHYAMAPFVPGIAILLVLVTFCVGSLFGLLFAVAWNWLSNAELPHGEPASSAGKHSTA